MSLKNIYFILVRPQLGENIGLVARAIKNFNITKLRIVNPRCNWPNQKALATSVGAKDILKESKVYHSIEKSISDLDMIFATSSRIRKVNKKIVSVFNLKTKIKIKQKNYVSIFYHGQINSDDRTRSDNFLNENIINSDLVQFLFIQKKKLINSKTIDLLKKKKILLHCVINLMK